jgi:SulP family sulfate permease
VKGVKFDPAYALRERLREGYTLQDFKSDLMSGAVVAMVAIPLSMALAIATGVAPQQGLYTAIVAGFLVALLGGSRTQVTGPTAAFVVILAPIVAKFGISGLLIAGLMAGVVLMAMGLMKLGQLVRFIPHPVTTGFTSGIAIVIATIQLKDFMGLKFSANPESFVDRIRMIVSSLPGLSMWEFFVGLLTLALLVAWPYLTRKIPAPLIVLLFMAGVAALLNHLFPEAGIATIASRFSSTVDGVVVNGIPRSLPVPSLPWSFGAANSTPLNFDAVQSLILPAVSIALLAAIESLLSAQVADGMAQTRHDPDAELFALGVGNVICPFLGAIPATGAIARTATNIRYGARSPISSAVHAVLILLSILIFAPLMGYLPMASLAALLILVAYNMSERRHFVHILKVGQKSDVIVLLACFGLTVIFDMVIGVTVGVVLASFLFMRRMAELSYGGSDLSPQARAQVKDPLPRGVMVYEISGPLFFGAAQRAMSAIERVGREIEIVIFRMDDVPAMDVTGVVALETVIQRIKERNGLALLAGIRPQPALLLTKSPAFADRSRVRFCTSLEDAIEEARFYSRPALSS